MMVGIKKEDLFNFFKPIIISGQFSDGNTEKKFVQFDGPMEKKSKKILDSVGEDSHREEQMCMAKESYVNVHEVAEKTKDVGTRNAQKGAENAYNEGDYMDVLMEKMDIVLISRADIYEELKGALKAHPKDRCLLKFQHDLNNIFRSGFLTDGEDQGEFEAYEDTDIETVDLNNEHPTDEGNIHEENTKKNESMVDFDMDVNDKKVEHQDEQKTPEKKSAVLDPYEEIWTTQALIDTDNTVDKAVKVVDLKGFDGVGSKKLDFETSVEKSIEQGKGITSTVEVVLNKKMVATTDEMPSFSLGLTQDTPLVLSLNQSVDVAQDTNVNLENKINVVPTAIEPRRNEKKKRKPAGPMKSPYQKRISPFDTIADERRMHEHALSNFGTQWDIVYNSSNGLSLKRYQLESLASASYVNKCVIYVWANVLNNAENLRNDGSIRRHFFTTEVMDEYRLKDIYDTTRDEYEMFRDNLEKAAGWNEATIRMNGVDLKNVMETHLSRMRDGRANTLKKGQQRCIKTKWQGKTDEVNSGVYLMRHMESYMGDEKNFEADFSKSDKKRVKQLGDLRVKYVSKILKCKSNRLEKFLKNDMNGWFSLDQETRKADLESNKVTRAERLRRVVP